MIGVKKRYRQLSLPGSLAIRELGGRLLSGSDLEIYPASDAFRPLTVGVVLLCRYIRIFSFIFPTPVLTSVGLPEFLLKAHAHHSASAKKKDVNFHSRSRNSNNFNSACASVWL